MIDPRHIRISDYQYDLPDERIAKFPMAHRDQSKLLIYNKGEVGEDVFYHLPDYLPKGALMVFNNTKVIQARMHFRKTDANGEHTGALIEVFLLEPAEPADYEQMFQTTGHCAWYCLVGNLKKWKEGPLTRVIEVEGTRIEVTATRGSIHGTSHRIDFSWEVKSLTSHPSSLTSQISFATIIDTMGELPIPPYLNRETQDSDKTTYQTVYSKIKGSVAAPTAGLHFTPEVLADLDAHGIEREELTLHVGAGTFKPVKSEEMEGHEMHTEYISVRRDTITKLLNHDCQAIAVGTTSVRTLESLYYMGLKVIANPDLTEDQLHVSQWEPYHTGDCPLCEQRSELQGDCPQCDTQRSLQALASWMDARGLEVLHASTQIIICPGYDYKIVRMLVTNFHQPQSTLLLLVSAFVGGDWHKIYDYALAHDFRFLSYGDSSLLIP